MAYVIRVVAWKRVTPTSEPAAVPDTLRSGPLSQAVALDTPPVLARHGVGHFNFGGGTNRGKVRLGTVVKETVCHHHSFLKVGGSG